MKEAGETRAYLVGDLTINSNIPLPELPPGNRSGPQCSFCLADARAQQPVAYRWHHQWVLPNGVGWLAFARQGSDYLLRFPNIGDFLISADGREVRCCPQPGTPLDTLRHLFLDQVVPLLLSKRGHLVLHASAVAAPEGTLGFVGASGQGKSTLALSFAKRGFPVLADDCLLLEERCDQLIAVPSYPGLRVWPEALSALVGNGASLPRVAHYTTKKRLRLADVGLPVSAGSLPLRRMYFLVPPEEAKQTTVVTTERLSPREAFMEMLKYAYLLDVNDRERLREQFDRLGRASALTAFYRLAFPRRLSLLPSVQDVILANLGEE